MEEASYQTNRDTIKVLPYGSGNESLMFVLLGLDHDMVKDLTWRDGSLTFDFLICLTYYKLLVKLYFRLMIKETIVFFPKMRIRKKNTCLEKKVKYYT